MSENQNETYIPADDEVKVSGGGTTWRFAGGKICKGSERLGTYQTRERVVGRLVRVGIHEGFLQDTGKPYAQLEADIMTSSGLVYVKSAISDDEGKTRSSVATNGLAWGLTQVAPGELICIEAKSGQPTPKGGIPTYVNLSRVSADNVATPIYRPKYDKSKSGGGNTVLDQWHELEPQIRQHPAFGPRPASRDDDPDGNATTHLSALCKECLDKGWPTPEQAPAEWLAMVSDYFEKTPAFPALGSVSEDQWGEVRQVLSDRREIPIGLADLVNKPKAGAFG